MPAAAFEAVRDLVGVAGGGQAIGVIIVAMWQALHVVGK
jgi:hypothetical protein